MTTYTGTLNISGSITAGDESADVTGSFGVDLSATLNSAGSGSGTETVNGSITVTYTAGGSGGVTVPFDLPQTNIQIPSGSFSISEPVSALNGIDFGVTLSGTVNANQSQISENILATASGTYQGISFNANIAASGLLQSSTPTVSPLTIAGATANVATSDTSSVAPFHNVVITDPNAGQTDTVTVSLSNPANGTLSNLGGGSYNASTGVYSVSGSAAAVTAALNALVFNPTAHQSAAGQTITTGFAIKVTDTGGQSASNSATTVVTTERPGLSAA